MGCSAAHPQRPLIHGELMNISRTRLRTAVVTPTALAGLVLSVLAGGIAAAAPSARVQETAASAAAPAAAVVPESAGSATGFAFIVLPNQQPGPCSPGLGTDFSTDPAIDRNDCAFVNFAVSDVSGAMTGELYAEDAVAPFAVRPVTNPQTDLYRVSLQPGSAPGNDWSTAAGKVRLVIKDSTGPIGETSFFFNQLTSTVDGGPATAPADGFTVTGTISKHAAGVLGYTTGVPAALKVRLTRPDGTILWTSPEVTASAAGAFSVPVPAGTASSINPDAGSNYQATLGVKVIDASYTDGSTGPWKATTAGTGSHLIKVVPTTLTLVNSFVSSVGWVKPGDTYPSRIIVTNPTAGSLTPTVDVAAPTGSTFVGATGPGTRTLDNTAITWSPGAIAPGATVTLVIESKAAPFTGAGALDTVVWRDLSSTAVLHTPSKPDQTVLSHGPKVIPPNETYDTARYGDRPFPVVPVEYTDRPYQDTALRRTRSSRSSTTPTSTGSTFNLFQEMSLGQLFPHGTVPSAGIASRGLRPTHRASSSARPTSRRTPATAPTSGDLPVDVAGTPLYPERITNGVYNLPGQTEYYGPDTNGSRASSAPARPSPLSDIDGGCGDTGKLVYDAAAIADPEIDYSDYDTDKDGVVDFFMVVFAGCGGNGRQPVRRGARPVSALRRAPYDNIWPHSSTLESGYTDPTTGLPGYTTDDQLKDLEGRPLWYTDDSYSEHDDHRHGRRAQGLRPGRAVQRQPRDRDRQGVGHLATSTATRSACRTSTPPAAARPTATGT